MKFNIGYANISQNEFFPQLNLIQFIDEPYSSISIFIFIQLYTS